MPKTTDLKPASEHALLRPGDECVLQIPKKQQREQGYPYRLGQIKIKGRIPLRRRSVQRASSLSKDSSQPHLRYFLIFSLITRFPRSLLYSGLYLVEYSWRSPAWFWFWFVESCTRTSVPICLLLTVLVCASRHLSLYYHTTVLHILFTVSHFIPSW